MLHDIWCALADFFDAPVIKDYLFPIVSSVYITIITIRLTQFYDWKRECMRTMDKVYLSHQRVMEDEWPAAKFVTTNALSDVDDLIFRDLWATTESVTKLEMLCQTTREDIDELTTDVHEELAARWRKSAPANLDEKRVASELSELWRERINDYFERALQDLVSVTNSLRPDYCRIFGLAWIARCKARIWISDAFAFVKSYSHGDDIPPWKDFRDKRFENHWSKY